MMDVNLSLLHEIFTRHPDSTINTDGDLVVPCSALVDILRTIPDICKCPQLLSPGDIQKLKELIASNPGLTATPQLVVNFINQRIQHAPPMTIQGPVGEQLSNVAGQLVSHDHPVDYLTFDAGRRHCTETLSPAPLSPPGSNFEVCLFVKFNHDCDRY